MASAKKVRLRPGRRFRPNGLVAGVERLEARLVLSFAAPVSYPVGTQATLGANGFNPQVITADFNDDGKLDLAVTNTADGTVSVLAGGGDGTFQAAKTFSTGLGGGNPVWLASADFNGDGKPDLVVEGASSVSLLLGNGDGTFQAPKVNPAGSLARGGLAVGDFFGNGRQDVAVAAFGSNAIEILPNNGDGTFGAAIALPMPASFRNIRSVATADLFGNGRADLVVAGNEGYNNVNSTADPAGVALFENDGQGHFTYTGQYAAVTTADPGGGAGTGDTVNPEHVGVADLNGDGKPDLVLSLYDHNIDVYLNTGHGTFGTATGETTETPGSVGGYPRGVAFADVNHDGKIDIITDNVGEPVAADQGTIEPGSLGILYGNGDGTFQAPVQYTPYTYPGAVAVGDFNGDGLPDLAVTQYETGHAVGVLLNQPGTANTPPAVTAIAPATGPVGGGTTVTITGTNFAGTTRVSFGPVSASFVVNSDTSITATSPASSAGSVDVTVYDAGASPPVSADRFSYTSGQSPAVTALTPAIGSTAGGTSVTITGTNFSGATSVRFGVYSAASFRVVSATSIIAVTPAEPVGVVDITVTTPAGPSPTLAADHFTFQTPAIASIVVTPGTASVIDGSSQPFVAIAFDQFGAKLATQPSIAWVSGGLGSVSASGVYTAPATGSGSAYVRAAGGGVSGIAQIGYSPLTAETWTGLGTTPNWSDPGNWSAKLVPSSATTVTFNATSLKNSVVDPAFGGTVGSVLITSIDTGTVSLSRNLTVVGTFTEGNGSFHANGFSASIVGATTLYAGTYLASTASQYFNGGLIVAGGTIQGSTGAWVAGSVTLSAGTLAAPSANFYVTGGNFKVTGGSFQADGGNVIEIGTNASPTLTLGTGLVTFASFTDGLTDTYPAGLTISGTLTATGTFAWLPGASYINGNIEARGDVDDEDHGGIGNPYLTLDGPANQRILDQSGGGGGQFRTIAINKAAGTVSLACNPIDFSGLNLIAGTVNTGSFAWYVTGPISGNPGLNLGNVMVDGPNVTAGGSSLQVASLAWASKSDKLTAPAAGYLFVSGSWIDSVGGAFAPAGGTVVFDGGGPVQQLDSVGASFNNLGVFPGCYVILEADVIVVGGFASQGTFNLNGHKLIR